MDPELVSRISKATGPFFDPLYLTYLMLDDLKPLRFFPAGFGAVKSITDPY